MAPPIAASARIMSNCTKINRRIELLPFNTNYGSVERRKSGAYMYVLLRVTRLVSLPGVHFLPYQQGCLHEVPVQECVAAWAYYAQTVQR